MLHNTPYYNRSDLQRMPELARLAPDAASSYFQFEEKVYGEESPLDSLTRELIAIAVAHVTGCPYCIDVHVRKCRQLGGNKEQILSAVLVAASTRAGAVLSHAAQALNAYDREPPEEPSEKSSNNKDNVPFAENDTHPTKSEASDEAGQAYEGPECFC